MALSVVQHVVARSALSANSVTATVTSTTAGTLLVVGMAQDGSSTNTATGVTDGGDTFTAATGAGTSGGGNSVTSHVYYCLSGAGGKTSVVGTFTNTDTSIKTIEVWEVSGWNTCVFDLAAGTTNGTGVGTDYSGPSVTTTGTTGFVVGVCVSAGMSVTVNPKAGNEFTAGGDISAEGKGFCSLISSTAAAHQPVWTGDSSGISFNASTAAFKDTGGGGGGGPTLWAQSLL